MYSGYIDSTFRFVIFISYLMIVSCFSEPGHILIEMSQQLLGDPVSEHDHQHDDHEEHDEEFVFSEQVHFREMSTDLHGIKSICNGPPDARKCYGQPLARVWTKISHGGISHLSFS